MCKVKQAHCSKVLSSVLQCSVMTPSQWADYTIYRPGCFYNYPGIPYYTLQYHTIPYHTIPHYIMPFHTLPYQIIPWVSYQGHHTMCILVSCLWPCFQSFPAFPHSHVLPPLDLTGPRWLDCGCLVYWILQLHLLLAPTSGGTGLNTHSL